MYKQTFIKKCVALFSGTTLALSFSFFGLQTASAAAVTSASDTLSSLKISTASNHDIVFTTPTGLTSGQTVLITFPSDFVINASLTYTDVDVLDDGAEMTLAASPTGGTWGVARTSATVLTLTNGTTAVAAGSVVRVKIGTNATNQSTGVYQVTNATTVGTKVITVGGGTFADSGSISVQLVTDDTVVISATVQQSISFTISTSTIYFGTLSSGAAKFASSTNSSGDSTETIAHTLAVGTNAPSGYTITAQGQTLTSQQNSANTIAAAGGTAASSAAGTEQFGIRATKAGGSNGTIDATFSGGSTYGYDATATTTTTFATGSSSTDTETFSLRYLANIAATTEAGTYTASLVYVATANF